MKEKKYFPIEKIPSEYDQDIFTRLTEDIYQNLQNQNSNLNKFSKDISKSLINLDGRVGSIENENKQAKRKYRAVMPQPTNVTCMKVPALPIFIAWCDPMGPIKYPGIRGFQFFGSTEKNFTPMIESNRITYNGICEATHETDMKTTATSSTKLKNGYTDLLFWHDMKLSGETIRNVTASTEGTIYSASGMVLSTSISWTDGDKYSFECGRPSNLIGQGPLPFAVKFLPPKIYKLFNPLWDKHAFYVKVRTVGRGGYSFFACASSTDPSDDLGAPTVNATPLFIPPRIRVTWTMGVTFEELKEELDCYKIYRTTANDTSLIDDDTYLVDERRIRWYVDTVNSGNIEANKTYYYWVRPVAKDGTTWEVGMNSAKLGKPNDPVIYDGSIETGGKRFFKPFTIKWTCEGGAEQYAVKRTFANTSVYGLPRHVKHTNEYGQEGGEDIQQWTFNNLLVGATYKFAVRAKNHLAFSGLWSDWDTAEYTVNDDAIPNAPS